MNKEQRQEQLMQMTDALNILAGAMARLLVEDSDYPAMLGSGSHNPADPKERYMVCLCTRDSADRLAAWMKDEQAMVAEASRKAGLSMVDYQKGDF